MYGDIRGKLNIAPACIPGGDGCLSDAGMAAKLPLDFAGLDTKAADFHLVVVPADIGEPAIRQPATQIACFVHAPAFRRERVGQEAFCGEIGTAEIALRHAHASHVQFARHPDGDRLHRFVENVDARVVDRPADG
ncbi:hypothetical protein GALL_427080 [mine drainage metagenome]|uniref:Uncharacterized protein n=1 Tax=mine drainage metagenome TaxID=410659 RepID=A0A1J5PVY2_9ZZZZ